MSTGNGWRPIALARETGVSTSTLRHYERVGVLPKAARTDNGYRAYPREAAARVRLVRAALDIGFTLRELAEVLALKDRGGRPCRKVRALADAKLHAIDAQMHELDRLKRKLTALTKEWDARLDRTPSGKRAHLLEALQNKEEERPHDDTAESRSRSRPHPRSPVREPGPARATPPARSR